MYRVYKTDIRKRWQLLRNYHQFEPDLLQAAAARRFLGRCSMDELHDVYTDDSALGIMASEELARRKQATVPKAAEELHG